MAGKLNGRLCFFAPKQIPVGMMHVVNVKLDLNKYMPKTPDANKLMITRDRNIPTYFFYFLFNFAALLLLIFFFTVTKNIVKITVNILS